MIVSHEHEFVFIKTNKTAGTSIEIALSAFCGAADIITPISPEDEKTRCALGSPGPQNYFEQPALGDRSGPCLGNEGTVSYYNHMSAREIIRGIGQETWRRYYTFCFERNPWDRLISMYYWRCRSEPRPTITAFLDSTIPLELKRKGRDLYMLDGEVAVDRLCRYEDIDQEFDAIRARLGISGRIELPKAKSRFREDRRSYREILGHDERDRIADMFAEEIELLGYRF